MTTWTPGPRRVPSSLKRKKIHESPIAVAAIEQLMCVAYECDPTAVAEVLRQPLEFTQEQGQSILLSLRWLTTSGILVNLSNMSETELDTLKTFVNWAIEKARPSVKERDAAAREAETRGDYQYARSNRNDPRISFSPGQE